MRRRILIASLFLGCLCAQQAAIAASIYSVTGLGILPGGYLTSTATSIDNQGEVAGYSSVGNGIQYQAFFWTQGGGLVGFGGNSKALGVNDGNVVGSDNGEAVRWVSGAETILDSPFNGAALSVNNSGAAVGNRQLVGVDRTIVWSNTNTVSNPFPLSDTGGIAINNLGQIVGRVVFGTGGYYNNGISATITGLGGLVVNGLSDNRLAPGFIVGVAAFRNIDSSSTTTIGSLLGDTTSSALGINPLGTQIVGISNGQGGFVYDIASSNLQSLTSLLAPAFNGWTILSANSVNDNGQIVGMGEFNGVQQAVLLNPVPEPSTAVLGGIGLVAYILVAILRPGRRIS